MSSLRAQMEKRLSIPWYRDASWREYCCHMRHKLFSSPRQSTVIKSCFRLEMPFTNMSSCSTMFLPDLRIGVRRRHHLHFTQDTTLNQNRIMQPLEVAQKWSTASSRSPPPVLHIPRHRPATLLPSPQEHLNWPLQHGQHPQLGESGKPPIAFCHRFDSELAQAESIMNDPIYPHVSPDLLVSVVYLEQAVLWTMERHQPEIPMECSCPTIAHDCVIFPSIPGLQNRSDRFMAQQ